MIQFQENDFATETAKIWLDHCFRNFDFKNTSIEEVKTILREDMVKFLDFDVEINNNIEDKCFEYSIKAKYLDDSKNERYLKCTFVENCTKEKNVKAIDAFLSIENKKYLVDKILDFIIIKDIIKLNASSDKPQNLITKQISYNVTEDQLDGFYNNNDIVFNDLFYQEILYSMKKNFIELVTNNCNKIIINENIKFGKDVLKHIKKIKGDYIICNLKLAIIFQDSGEFEPFLQSTLPVGGGIYMLGKYKNYNIFVDADKIYGDTSILIGKNNKVQLNFNKNIHLDVIREDSKCPKIIADLDFSYELLNKTYKHTNIIFKNINNALF